MSNNQSIEQIVSAARQAIAGREWRVADRLTRKILKRDRNNVEGSFLAGLAAKATGKPQQAEKLFLRALRQDENRFDAAIELSNLYAGTFRYGEAFAILENHAHAIGDRPRFLNMAAAIYSQIGKWAQAWSLLERADELQPNVAAIMASKAQCAVSLGKIGEAKSIYRRLLQQQPAHQRNHYQMSRLDSAQDDQHIKEMLQVLDASNRPPQENIFLHYALGKEFEDLERWDDSFEHYSSAGDAAAAAAGHDIQTELVVVDAIIEVCSKDWLTSQTEPQSFDNTPIFIVGLPRTGTTLVERIISSHSKVDSIGETLAIENLLRADKGRVGAVGVAAIRAAAARDAAGMADDYLSAVKYMLGKKPFFVEKYTYNYLYLGFIARAFPDAHIIHLQRNPMDACFAMYKQPYFSFAFTLDDLAQYYPAYNRLMNHWRAVLGSRLIEVSYEAIVADAENQTRQILDKLGLEFENACLEFDRNLAPSATASAVQIRDKIHSRSVGRWKNFEKHLRPLQDKLVRQGIDVDGGIA